MSGEHDWFLIVWALVCIVVVLAMSYWVTKYVAGKGTLRNFSGRRGDRQIEVLAQEIIGREQRLVIVRAGERYFLLGATANNISMLSEMTKEEAALWESQPAQARNADPPSFFEAFTDALKQRTRGEKK